MNLIAAGLCDYVDVRSGRTAVLGLIVACLDPEFGDGVQTPGQQARAALVAVRHVGLIDARGIHSVNRELIVHRMQPVERQVCNEVAARNRPRHQ